MNDNKQDTIDDIRGILEDLEIYLGRVEAGTDSATDATYAVRVLGDLKKNIEQLGDM